MQIARKYDAHTRPSGMNACAEKVVRSTMIVEKYLPNFYVNQNLHMTRTKLSFL
jgi:hypothetical protein